MLLKVAVTFTQGGLEMKNAIRAGAIMLSLALVLLPVLVDSVIAQSAGPEPTPASVVSRAIRHKTPQEAADILLAALEEVIASEELTEAMKRELVIAITTEVVATAGADAAQIMGAVVGKVTPSWVPVIVATSIVASGDSSPAMAAAMLAAVSSDTELSEIIRSSAADPGSVLQASEIGTIRETAIQIATRQDAPPATDGETVADEDAVADTDADADADAGVATDTDTDAGDGTEVPAPVVEPPSPPEAPMVFIQPAGRYPGQ